METAIDYNRLFNMFTGNDDSRRFMKQPFKQDGKYIATDAICMIWMPTDKIGLHYEELERPSVQHAIPTKTHNPISIDIEHLKSKLIAPMVDEYTQAKQVCPECDGEKKVRCNYGHKHDCDECKQTGFVQDGEKTGKQIMDPDAKFIIHDVAYSWKNLKKLFKACEILGVSTIQKVSGTGGSGNLFLAGEASILIMPLYQGDDPEGSGFIRVEL